MRLKSPEHPLVYLACPYSHSCPDVRQSRFNAANRAAVYLIEREGANVFSPITHSHPLHDLGLNGDWSFWERFDREYLALSHKLVILTVRDWRESTGVLAERKIAWDSDLTVEYLDPNMVNKYFADKILVKAGILKETAKPLPIHPAYQSAAYGPPPEMKTSPGPLREDCAAVNPANRPLKDSGTRKEFSGGAVRDTAEGKGRYDLISPHSIFRIANIFEKGAKKYAARNWEKGMNLSRLVDSALRHTFQYLEGNRDEDHIAQAAWNLMAALHTEEMIRRGVLPKSFDDLPNHIKPADKVADECFGAAVKGNHCHAITDEDMPF